MKKTKWASPLVIFILVLVVSVLTGCSRNIDFSPPLITGGVDTNGKTKNLTPKQLLEISNWLEKHRSGWGYIVAPDPFSFRVYASFKVYDSEGQAIYMDLYSIPQNEKGQTKMVKIVGYDHTHDKLKMVEYKGYAKPSHFEILNMPQFFTDQEVQPLSNMILD